MPDEPRIVAFRRFGGFKSARKLTSDMGNNTGTDSKCHIMVVAPYRHWNAMSGSRMRASSLCRELSQRPDIRLTTLAPFPLTAGAAHIAFCLDGNLIERARKLMAFHRLTHRLHPDIVLFEGPLMPITLGRFAAVQVIHDTKFATEHARRGHKIAKHLYALSVHLANKVLTVSNAEAAAITRLYRCGQKVVVSYNGVDAEWFKPPTKVPQWRHDIIYVSNFASHKGHLDLLRSTMDADYRIAFVGRDFGEAGEIRNLAAKSRCTVTFYQDLSEPDLIALYDASKISVFPSRLEGFGIPFLEARCRGLPVIANDIAVFRELAALLGGTIVNCTDDGALAAAIHKALAVTTRQYPSAEALNAFRWPTIVDRLLHNLGVEVPHPIAARTESR
jgi:glycosyltransferase involved in cell wall biosynthesis